MNLFEDTNPRELGELLGQIHTGDSALPDFQRDFVWDPNMTEELIVSIASNYPAGSLLRIRNTHNLFAYREFQGAPPVNGHKPTYLVLDGQQRLTSLYQAFYGVGEHRYYLNVQSLLDGKDMEECIFHLRSNSRKALEYENLDAQARDLVLPLSQLKDGNGGFLGWMLRIAEKAATSGERMALQDRLMKHVAPHAQTIDDYHFPVVTLSDSTSADAVCTIFETLNRTGVKLSAFELLTARFWPKGINLRGLWAEAQRQYPILSDFAVDPYYLLQIVSLVSRATPSCKRNDVLDLDTGDIDQWWGKSVQGLANALAMLRDDCGVMVPGWLPYNTIVVPFAAVLAKMPLAGGPIDGARRKMLTRWYWCSVFGQAYESAPNSQSAKDTTELIRWLGGGVPPETVSTFHFDPSVLRETAPRQRAVYRGVICLILRRSPRDFYNGAKLTSDLIVAHQVDDHHVFPQGYLDPRGIDGRRRDCVLNRTLIDRRTNIRISNRAPSDYMAEIQGALDPAGNGSFDELLRSHFLPSEKDSPLWRDDFEGLLSWRQQVIGDEIQKVTGAD